MMYSSIYTMEIFMPFEQTNVKDILEIKLQDKEFKDAYDQVKSEYRIIEQIVKQRKSKKMTQKELAQKANVSQQAISRLEKEKHIPNMGTLIRILNGLGLELNLVQKSR
jgi:DNA-binding XRE family transcriptional regulator